MMNSHRIIFLLLLLYNKVNSYADYENVGDVGFTSTFTHKVKVLQGQGTLYEGEAVLKVSRPDFDTLVVVAHKAPQSPKTSSLVRNMDGGLVLRTMGGRISSILRPPSLTSWELNYLRSITSTLFIPKEKYDLSYYTVTDSFGTCELTVQRNRSRVQVTRDLTRCSHPSVEFTNSIHFLPLFHVSSDLSGSSSSCKYEWKEENRNSIKEISCQDDFHIAKRFSQNYEVNVTAISTMLLRNRENIQSEVYEYINGATESINLMIDPLLPLDEKVIEKEELDLFLGNLCSTSRDHMTKDGLLISSQVFHALSRAKTPPEVLKYPCPSNIRRSVAYAAALIGGPRFLNFVHDQMMMMIEENLELFPGPPNPMLTIAISNLAEPNLNPKDPISPEFFVQPEVVQKLEKIIEILLVSGEGALPGVTALLEKLRLLSPTLYKDTIIKASVIFSPEEACSAGNSKEATRILHAVSSLSVRASNYVASLRPCFATEDVGVQVAAMNSLQSLDCDTPGLLELEQLALESPADPEIRIAAFKGIVKCIPGRPALIPTLEGLLDKDAENYSIQVASFVWSFIQATLESTNANLIDIQLELEDIPGVFRAQDPVSYDIRQYSRHLERNFILDPRTSVTGVLELIWGRASPIPRSLVLGISFIHDGANYDFMEVIIRITGLEQAFFSIPKMRELRSYVLSLRERLWRKVEELTDDFWGRFRRDVDQNSIREFVKKVIAQIPADFKAYGSTFELSLSLFGFPALHAHFPDVDGFLRSIPDTVITLTKSNFHSEVFQLMPFVDNTINLATSGGIPLMFQFSSSAGVHSLFSHYVDDQRGSVDFVVSGGLTLETSMKIGLSLTEFKKGTSEILTPKQIHPEKFSEMFSEISTKFLWTVNFPVSFSYSIKSNDFMLKFRRPSVLPHYFWQREKVTLLNRKPLPLRYTVKCLTEEEEIKICLVSSVLRTYSNELEILNNEFLKPEFMGIRFDIPKGFEPVVVQVIRPEQSPGRSVTTITMEIPTDKESLKYEGMIIVYSTAVRSVAFSLHSPSHKYYIKGYWSLTIRERWLLGVEFSIDDKLHDLKFQVTFAKVANQKIITLVLSFLTPSNGEEELIRVFIADKEFSGSSSVEINGGTHGPLADIVAIVISGNIKKTTEGASREISLEEFRINIPEFEGVFISGRFARADTGTDTSLYIIYGTNYETRIAFSFSPIDLGPTAYLLPAQVKETVFGGTYSVNLLLKHPYLVSPFTLGVSGSIHKGELDFDATFQFENSTAKVLFFIIYESFKNFRSIASLEYKKEEIAWSYTQDVVWSHPDYKVGVNASWSPELQDRFAFLVHFTRGDSFDHSLNFKLRIPSQKLEIKQDLSRAVAESYKHKLILKADPGRDFIMNTVVVAGKDPSVVTYGLSVDFKLEGWDDFVRVVGTAKCVNGYTKCTLNTVIDWGPEKIAEFQVKYTGSITGVSRTDIQLTVTNYVSLESSIDIILKAGTLKFRLVGDVKPWERQVKGSINLSWKSTDVAEAQFYALMYGDEEIMTHYYNGTLSIDRETRTLFSRQELRGDVNGIIETWAAIIQAKIGVSILNDNHFAKAALTTPYDTYYSVSGEASSQVVKRSLAIGKIILAADIGQSRSYLLGWNLNLKADPQVFDSRFSLEKDSMTYGERDLITLTTLGRLKSPTTGEMKLNVKAKRTHVFQIENTHYSNIIEVRLVKESFPELGRMTGKLIHNQESYSLSSRIWSGPKSLSLETYGVSRVESLKNSVSLTVVDPSSTWQIFESKLEGDHVGTIPYNFESTLDFVVSMQHERLGSLKALAQWTPSTAALSLGLGMNFGDIPGGQVFFKWTTNRLESKIAVLDLRTALEAKWGESGKKLDLAYTFSHPKTYFTDIDSTFNFHMTEGYIFIIFPKTLILKGRLSVNTVHHWILNIEQRLKEKRVIVKGAVIRPQNPAAFSLEIFGMKDNRFHTKWTLLIDATSHHVTLSLTPMDPGEELTLVVRSSLLPEEGGYVLRVWKNFHSPFEIGLLFSEGSNVPLWSYIYRLRGEPKYSNLDFLEEIKIEDYYSYRENQTYVISKRFIYVELKIKRNRQSYGVIIEFPEWFPGSEMEGTIDTPVGENEIVSFLRMEVPDNDHIIELKYSHGESIYDWHSGRVIYRQRLIKGVGHPLRLELEAKNIKGEKKDFTFSLYKVFSQKKKVKGIPRKGTANKEDTFFKTYKGRLVTTDSSSFKEYKLSWETNDSKNNAEIILELDSSGASGHVKYERNLLNSADPNDFVLLKGNCRRFPSEVTCSITMEHVSGVRPRSLTLLHSEAEEYSEVIFDFFRSGEDQIIMVFNRKNELTFRIGQFGNNFLKLSYRSQNGTKSENTLKSLMVEVGGHSLDIKLGESKDSSNYCHWLMVVIATPNLAQMYNTITICPSQNEFIIQLLGLEANEGPYCRIGEISGPGGGGVQVGRGMLRPLNTPPALTLTADKKERFLEVLFDLQINSMNQLMEDLNSRMNDFEAAAVKVPQIQLKVNGVLAIEKSLNDIERLFNEAAHVLKPFIEELKENIDESMLERAKNSTEFLKEWIEIKGKESMQNMKNLTERAEDKFEELLFKVQRWIARKEAFVIEVLDNYTGDLGKVLDSKVWPMWIKVSSGLRALRYNDNQSLYALVSRIMSYVHVTLGRKVGAQGFLLNDLLTKTEQMAGRWMRWEKIRKKCLSMIRGVESVTRINFIMNHDTGFKFQIPELKVLWSDFVNSIKELKEREYLNKIKSVKEKLKQWKARLLAIRHWKIQGRAIVIGWEQAISWDDRFLSPLLSDNCPHLLMSLTRLTSPIAITLHLRSDGHQTIKVLTFISRGNEVSVDSTLQIEVNGRPMKAEEHIIADLDIRKLPSEIRITSSEGVTLECFTKGDLCYIKIERENFANTAGLLGVFDFERNTDFMTSAWERPASGEEWSRSWKIRKEEECQKIPEKENPLQNWEQKCSDLFSGENSPFRTCLQVMSSKPYEASCRGGRMCSADEAMKRSCQERFTWTEDSQFSCGTPQVRLFLNPNIPEEEIAENSTVRLECQVRAEPSIVTLTFLKDNTVVRSNISNGVKVSGNVLLLENIKPAVLGWYSCQASNSIGSSESNSVFLSFEHKPICSRSTKKIGVVEGEMVALECHVKANPNQVFFSWSIGNGDESTQLSKSTYTSYGLVSRMKFVPYSESDFGRVLCWATNQVGRQEEPCEFLISPRSHPDECSEPRDERRGTENLHEEIVFIGDVSCADSVREIVQTIREKNPRNLKFILRYTKEESVPEASRYMDEMKACIGEDLVDLVYKSVEEDFSKDSLKAIILFNCNSKECDSEREDDLGRVVSLSEKLRKVGLQLYTVTKETIPISEASKVPNKVRRQLLGIDRRTSYMMSHARKKNLKGKRGIRKHLSIPENNLCADLSLQSDGAVFSLKVLKKLKKKHHRKLFNEIIGLRLLKGHKSEYLECRTCHCHHVCHLCNPVPAVESEILDFEADDDDYGDYFYN